MAFQSKQTNLDRMDCIVRLYIAFFHDERAFDAGRTKAISVRVVFIYLGE
jgi:hypothetical protein